MAEKHPADGDAATPATSSSAAPSSEDQLHGRLRSQIHSLLGGSPARLAATESLNALLQEVSATYRRHDQTLAQISQQLRVEVAMRDRVMTRLQRLKRQLTSVTGTGSETPAGTDLEQLSELIAQLVQEREEAVSERSLAQERIRHLAHHDELTGLPNRNLFRDRAQQAMAQAERTRRRVGLIFLDLDRFKHINDSLGHHAGDKLLQHMAETLAAAVRQSDTVARLGGDEFVIVLPEVRDAQDLTPLAQKLLEIITAPVLLEGNELHVSASIGISVFPDDGANLDTLMRNADTAMYHAKESGRNNFQYFTPRMNELAQERLAMETRLRRAIRNEQFVLHYQPIVSTATGDIVSVEALVRWEDPEHGLIPPAQFIRIAEEAGLIGQLGAWVLREACRQNRAWQHAGLIYLPVAVNLSAEQFRNRSLLDTVSEALALSGLEPRCLALEITETLLMEQSDQIVELLSQLKAMGLQLSIDDFGTGYSSLSYLSRFPIHKLKIDKSFVRDMRSDPSHAAITSAVIALAHSLRLKVLAEGVEHREQLEFLRLRGCHEVQGYLFSRPLPAEAFAELVRNWDPRAYAVPLSTDALHPFIAV